MPIDLALTSYRHDSREAILYQQEEFELQRFIARLDSLRSAAAAEYQLKGPFPNASFEIIMKSTIRILEAFHALNVAILRESKPSKCELELLGYTDPERRQLSTRISHLFQGLSASLIEELFTSN